METVIDPHLDLVQQLTKAARGSATALGVRARTSAAADLDRTVSVLAKQLAKQSVEGVGDRQARAVARTEIYNRVRPVLEAMALQQQRISKRARQLAFGAVALISAVAALIASHASF